MSRRGASTAARAARPAHAQQTTAASGSARGGTRSLLRSDVEAGPRAVMMRNARALGVRAVTVGAASVVSGVYDMLCYIGDDDDGT